MPENKTQPTGDDVQAFVAATPDEGQRADAAALVDMLTNGSGDPPVLWGKIVGFGSYHYRYDSGHEGHAPRIGFAPRKGQTVIYLMSEFPERDDLLARLGKHKTGKACLYLKHLSDVDAKVLAQLARASLAETDRRYPR